MSNNNLYLMPCCPLVKGYNASCIYDLQRNNIYRFPNKYLSLFKVKDDNKMIGINESKDLNDSRFINDLKKSQLCVNDKNKNFRAIDTRRDYSHNIFGNCIIDRSEKSTFSLKKCAELLDNALCEAITIRYFYPISLEKLTKDLVAFNNSTVRSLEIHFKPKNDIQIEDLEKIKEQFGRVCKIFIHSQSVDKLILNGEDFAVQFSISSIENNKQCGFTSEFNMNAQTQFYIESKNHNNCLYRKIAFDQDGLIKNCPAMKESFGSIYDKNIDLTKLLTNKNFTKFWNINKDKIDVCKDCEYRYACLDCRCFRMNEDIYSKPKKCKYNPYE